MGDEFTEHDPATPTEHDLDETFGSQFLNVADVGDKKIRTKILRVRKEEVEDRKSGKLKPKIVVFFENLDKGLILNATNKDILIEAYGKKPAGWLRADIGIYVDPNVMFGGVKKGGVRLKSILPPAPAAKAVPATPTPAANPPAAATTAWPEQTGDPGPSPADFR